MNAVCEFCSTPFRPHPRSAGRFCSRQCYYDAEQAMAAARRWAERRARDERRERIARGIPPTPEERAVAQKVSDECMAAYAALKEATT